MYQTKRRSNTSAAAANLLLNGQGEMSEHGSETEVARVRTERLFKVKPELHSLVFAEAADSPLRDALRSKTQQSPA